MNYLYAWWKRNWRAAVGLAPKAPFPVPARRLLRATCEFCGKDVAVIASTGRLWKHDCNTAQITSESVCPPADEEPADALQHDTWEEHAGLR